MPNDNIRTSGAPKNYKDDTGGAVVLPHACLGVVKDNIDPTHSGRIKVYINRGGAKDPNDSRNWITVSYLSPWFGVISPGYDIYGDKSAERTGPGKYVGNPHSYGFWASAPDLGTTVVCVFINGRADQGYYIGCVPQPGLTHMTPGVAASARVVPNSSEATSYGGADRLPVTEVNYANPSIRNSPTIYDQPKPVHSYQASILAKQGLVRDNLRGVISSSSQRETPSKVFGMSTPGTAIYSGGYDPNNIATAAQDADKSKLQIMGRTGGHSFVMDDGDLKGQDQLVRLRTSAGHMIMMNDSGQNLTIVHSNGQTWIEMNREGAIDVFASNSVNIRTEGDLNLHADRDINFHAKRNINAFAENIKLEADKNMSVRTGENFNQYTVAQYTVKVDGPMSMESKADASYASKAITYINGTKKIHLNTGATSTVPQLVKAMPKQTHQDTTFSQKVGWMTPSPNVLLSITTRAPTHWPYYAANKGVDVKTGNSQPAAQPQPTAGVTAANAGAATQLTNPTNSALVSTVPSTPAAAVPGGPVINSQTTQSMVSQQAAAAGALTAAEKVQNGIVGTAGSTLSQLAAPGQSMKPGSDALVKAIQNKVPNIPGARAATNVLMTGNQGVGSYNNLEKNVSAQVGAVTQGFQQSATQLKQAGILKGTETGTEIAGVVQAAANFGAKAVAGVLAGAAGVSSALGSGLSALNNATGQAAGAVGAAVGSAFKSLGGAIAGGNFGAALSDKLNSGLSGVNNSLSSLAGGASLGDISKAALGGLGNAAGALAGAASGAVGGLASLAQNALGGVKGGIGSLISGLKGVAQNAFAVTEKGFGELKGGVPNVLGGAPEVKDTASAASKALDSQESALEAKQTAQQSLDEAQKAYRLDPTPENQSKLKEAQAAVADASKKALGASRSLLSGAAPSAQGVAAAAASVASGESTVATTLNSGINAIPGGAGAYANEISEKSNNVIGSVKSLGTAAGAVTSSVSSAGGVASAAGAAAGAVLNNTSALAGNLVGNAQKAITGVGDAVASQVQGAAGSLGGAAGALGGSLGAGAAGAIGGVSNALGGAASALGGAAGSVTGALGGAAGALNNLSGGAKSAAAGLFSKTQAALGSLGNNDNQIKTPILASGTFAAATSQGAKVAQLLGDTKVPTPKFEDKPVEVSIKEIDKRQADFSAAVQTVKDKRAERLKVEAKFNAVAVQLRDKAARDEDVSELTKEYKALEAEFNAANEAETIALREVKRLA